MKESLFGRQPSSSPHVDVLRVNRDWQPMTLRSIVSASLFVTIELCITALFVLGCLAVRSFASSPLLLGLLVLVTFASMAWLGLLGLGQVVLLSILYVLTPVLASLARPISDDTISNSVGLLLVLHIFAYDYFAREDHRPLVSTNAGLLSAILLCSRLPAYHQVFSSVLLGILLFALWPIVLIRVCRVFPRAHFILAATLTFCVFGLLLLSFRPLAFVFAGLVWIVNVVAPLLFYRLQRLKHVLSGQWTEAQIS